MKFTFCRVGSEVGDRASGRWGHHGAPVLAAGAVVTALVAAAGAAVLAAAAVVVLVVAEAGLLGWRS